MITNAASIVFDWNDPIVTPEVSNTIDAAPPASRLRLQEPAIGDDLVLLEWDAEDDPGGLDSASYNTLVSVEDQPFGIWLERTEATSATFRGLAGHRYAFYTLACDNVGRTEDPTAEVDTSTPAVEPPLALSDRS